VKLNQTFDGFKRTWVEVLAIVLRLIMSAGCLNAGKWCKGRNQWVMLCCEIQVVNISDTCNVAIKLRFSGFQISIRGYRFGAAFMLFYKNQVKDDGLVDIRMISDLGPYMDPGLMHKVVQFMQDNVYPDCL